MQTNAFVLALMAGLISAVVFASATTGPVVLRFLLYVLTPLSLYLVGLGLGPIAAAIAAIAGMVVIILFANPLVAFAYGVSTALPAFVLTRLALLSRGDGPEREWYPPGRLVAAAALFGGAFAFFILMAMGGDADTLAKTTRELVATFVKTEMPGLPSGETLTEAQIDEIAKTTLATLPFALGTVAMGTVLFNLWLAGRITLASGRLLRPWPDLRQIALPASATFALLIATLLTFTGGMPGLVATGIAGAFTLAFALVGLASAHVLLSESPWRPFALWAIYIGLIFATGPMLLILALGGLAETIFNYRQRHPDGPAPPD